jgi:hypothetical protein
MNTCKKLTRKTPFKLVYGQETMVPLEFLAPSLCIVAIKERQSQLMDMEEERILEIFHQQLHKESEKSWLDIHIKRKSFKEGNLILVYENKFHQHPGKFRMHWLGPNQVKTITDGGFV